RQTLSSSSPTISKPRSPFGYTQGAGVVTRAGHCTPGASRPSFRESTGRTPMKMNKKTIRDVDFAGKRVLMRVDFNVPIDGGEVADDTRIVAALPTINAVLDGNPRALILMSHLGRPKDATDAWCSLKSGADELADGRGRDVAVVEATVGDEVEQEIENLPEGGVLLLENKRFRKAAKSNDAESSKKVTAL